MRIKVNAKFSNNTSNATIIYNKKIKLDTKKYKNIRLDFVANNDKVLTLFDVNDNMYGYKVKNLTHNRSVDKAIEEYGMDRINLNDLKLDDKNFLVNDFKIVFSIGKDTVLKSFYEVCTLADRTKLISKKAYKFYVKNKKLYIVFNDDYNSVTVFLNKIHTSKHKNTLDVF